MKKIFLIMLIVLALTACSTYAPNDVHSNSEKLEVDSETEFTPDFETIKNIIKHIKYLHWESFDGMSWSEYGGFKDTEDLSSDSLLNFFFSVADGRQYYNEKSSKYYFDENDIRGVLDQYFKNYNFNVSDIKDPYRKPTKNGVFILSGFFPFGTNYDTQYTVDSWGWNENDQLIAIHGTESEDFRDEIAKYHAEFYFADGKYYIKKFSYYCDMPEQNIPAKIIDNSLEPYLNNVPTFEQADFEQFLENFVCRIPIKNINNQNPLTENDVAKYSIWCAYEEMKSKGEIKYSTTDGNLALIDPELVSKYAKYNFGVQNVSFSEIFEVENGKFILKLATSPRYLNYSISDIIVQGNIITCKLNFYDLGDEQRNGAIYWSKEYKFNFFLENETTWYRFVSCTTTYGEEIY